MSFWNKFKMNFARFMVGRYGPDELSRALTWAGLAFLVISIFGGGVFYFIALVMYGLSLFRMFSKNATVRFKENAAYLNLKRKVVTEVKQAQTRWNNRKTYKYFRCPNCKARLRLPRNVGEVTVNCGQCKNSFRKKA